MLLLYWIQQVDVYRSNDELNNNLHNAYGAICLSHATLYTTLKKMKHLA